MFLMKRSDGLLYYASPALALIRLNVNLLNRFPFLGSLDSVPCAVLHALFGMKASLPNQM